VLEALLYAALALWLASRRPVRELVRALGPGQRAFAAALVAALVGGQLFDDGARTFPFVPWAMYTQRSPGDPVFCEYRLRRASGSLEDLTAFRPGAAMSVQMHHRLEVLSAQIEGAGDEAARTNLLRDYDHVLQTVAAAAASRRSDDPPVAVEVERVTVPLRSYSGPESLRREPFRRVEIR